MKIIFPSSLSLNLHNFNHRKTLLEVVKMARDRLKSIVHQTDAAEPAANWAECTYGSPSM